MHLKLHQLKKKKKRFSICCSVHNSIYAVTKLVIHVAKNPFYFLSHGHSCHHYFTMGLLLS